MQHFRPDRVHAPEVLWRTDTLPFTVGCTPAPHNPAGLPDVFPFTLALDRRLGLLVQLPEPGLDALLRDAYAAGSLLGTAMDDTPLGRRYAEDFLQFIACVCTIEGRRILEIGAGRGYLLRLLVDRGAAAFGIEPGVQNAPHWERFGVDVIADSFPSPTLDEAFDVIVSYAVMEHIADIDGFLADIRRHLRSDGIVVVSVPSSAEYTACGDPSLLLHEHFSYFTVASLRRVFACNGLEVIDVRKAGFGGALYAAAKLGDAIRTDAPSVSELAEARAFGDSIPRLQASFRARLDAHRAAGRRVGIYCPARALALLDSGSGLRFFDDDPDLQGRFYPPFECVVEPRRALLEEPVDELWIMSRTFGTALRAKLAGEPALSQCEMRLPGELLPA